MRSLVIRVSIGIATFAIGVAVMTCFRWVVSPPIAPSRVIPESWKKIEQNRFSFYVPSDFANGIHRGIDSDVWESHNSTMDLVYDYGEYSGDLNAYANQPEYHAEWFRISGHVAKLETLHMSGGTVDRVDANQRYIAAVYFPNVGNRRAKLTFHVQCADAGAQETAKTILLSIRFK